MADVLRLGRHIDLLSAALIRRGLRVQVTDDVVTARNFLSRLHQDVVLRETDAGLMWCWVWHRPAPAERDAPMPEPEIEPMCRADDVDQAARLIVKVVSGRAEEPVDV